MRAICSVLRPRNFFGRSGSTSCSGGVAASSAAILSPLIVGLASGAALGWQAGLLVGLPALLIILLIFGLGEPSKWAIVAVAVFFQVLISTLAGVVNIDRVYLDVAADFRASRWQAYRTIALPGALPFIFTGFQLGLGMALIVVVIAENFGTEHGLGYLIWHSWQIFEVRDMYVGLIMVALLGYTSQLAMARLERSLIPWKRGGHLNIRSTN